MAIITPIEWCDSSANIQMGCDGCELWTRDGSVRTCYAGVMTDRYIGLRPRPGWPKAFNQPALFLERLNVMKSWPDLTGQKRPAKPWLNGLPRCIFLNDMGDTFTASLPLDWLMEPYGGSCALTILAKLPAIIMLCTKRPDRMRQFFEQYPCPDNFIPMTSITGPQTLNRLRELLKIKARWHGVSAEPLLKGTVLGPYLEKLTWVITGLESGTNRRGGTNPDLLPCRELRDECRRLGLPFFMKQVDKVIPIPPDLMIREMPAFTLPTIEKEGTLDLWPLTP